MAILRHGYRRLHPELQRKGWPANHRRIWRLYSKAVPSELSSYNVNALPCLCFDR